MKKLHVIAIAVSLLVGGATLVIYSRGSHIRATESKPFPLGEQVSPGSMDSSQKHGYILTLVYSGQQGAGVRALVSQQCWVKSFNLPMHIVEPFVTNSILGSKPRSRYNTTHLVRLGHFFDIHHFNNVSQRNGYPTLVSWEDFLQNAPRNVIVVWMQTNIEEKPAEILWDARNSDVQCYRDLSYYPGSSHMHMRKLAFLVSENLCVVRFATAPYKFASSHIFSASEMHSVLFQGWNLEEVTLIFSLWRGPWCVPNPQLKNPLVCTHATQEGVMGKLRPSPQLLRHAQQYEQLFLKPKNSLAVMIRAERVLYRFGTGKGKASDGTLGIYSCMKQLVNLTRTLQNRLVYDKAFITSDVGDFASATWRKTFSNFKYSKEEQPRVIQAIKDTVSELYHQKWTFEEWEDSFSQATGGIEDRGYIAALQRIIASRAECLVLAGGGTFQKLALQDYLTNHPDPSKHCIHFVCGQENHVNEMQQMIAESRQA